MIVESSSSLCLLLVFVIVRRRCRRPVRCGVIRYVFSPLPQIAPTTAVMSISPLILSTVVVSEDDEDDIVLGANGTEFGVINDT